MSTTTTMNTAEALTWISEVFEEPPGRIVASTRRDDIAGWDSLGTLSLIAGLDERFDIHLSEKDIENLQSVKDVFEILRSQGALSD